MKWSAERIVEEYKKDISRANMERIAQENDCTLKEIGEFLQQAALEPLKRRPERPKKQKADKTKKDENQKVRLKVEPVEENKRPHTYLIPTTIESMAKAKIEELRRRVEFFKTKAQEAELEADELQDFLNGGYCNGQKDGV